MRFKVDKNSGLVQFDIDEISGLVRDIKEISEDCILLRECLYTALLNMRDVNGSLQNNDSLFIEKHGRVLECRGYKQEFGWIGWDIIGRYLVDMYYPKVYKWAETGKILNKNMGVPEHKIVDFMNGNMFFLWFRSSECNLGIVLTLLQADQMDRMLWETGDGYC